MTNDIPEIAESPAADVCEWWSYCTRPASTYRMSPLLMRNGSLGEQPVPICKECDEKVSRIEGNTRKTN